jgi:hypothetical protein
MCLGVYMEHNIHVFQFDLAQNNKCTLNVGYNFVMLLDNVAHH